MVHATTLAWTFAALFGDADPTSGWQQFGAWGFGLGVLVWVIIDQRATIKAQRDELTKVREQMISEVVPTAVRMVDALHAAAEATRNQR